MSSLAWSYTTGVAAAKPAPPISLVPSLLPSPQTKRKARSLSLVAFSTSELLTQGLHADGVSHLLIEPSPQSAAGQTETLPRDLARLECTIRKEFIDEIVLKNPGQPDLIEHRLSDCPSQPRRSQTRL